MKRLLGLVCILALAFSPLSAQSLPGYTSVKTQQLESWLKTIQQLQLSLTLKSESLKQSGTNVANLMSDIDHLNKDIMTWENQYQDLLTDFQILNQDSEEWQARFTQLEQDFKQILQDYQNLQKKLEQLSKKLRNRNLTIVGLIIVTVVEGVLIYVLARN